MRRMYHFIVLLLVATPLVGCSWWQANAGDRFPEPDDYPIAWEKAGSYCGRKSPLRLVARNRAEMALCPISNVPVDFSRQMVLAAVMGRVTSDQYAIRIRRIWREESILKVDVQVYRPRATTQPTIQLACPYHVIVVPRSNLNVEGFSPDPRRATKVRGAGAMQGF